MEGRGFYLSRGGPSVTVADLEPSSDYGELVPCTTTSRVSQKPQAVKCSFPTKLPTSDLAELHIKTADFSTERRRKNWSGKNCGKS